MLINNVIFDVLLININEAIHYHSKLQCKIFS